MINALHLLWIVPVCGAIRFLTAAIIASDREDN